MLDPLSLDRSGSRRDATPGNDPHRGQIPLLAEVGSQHSHVEVLPLHAAQPPLENANRRVDGDGLVGIRRGARPQRTGVDSILPEERPHPCPVTLRQTQGISVQQLVDRIFVPASTSRGTILDPAAYTRQEADTEKRETQTAQADRWCVSST